MAAGRKKIPPVKGVSALVPDEAASHTLVEQTLSRCAQDFGYRELRIPLLERTELFARSLGAATDIVHKEMFSFEMHGKESLSLRPEGTAGAVRSVLEHSLADRRPGRFWYCGPMFRYEQPQKGRSRQFHQFGVEAFGMPGVEIEFEVLSMCTAIWGALGITDRLELQISSLGSEKCRQAHKAALLSHFDQYMNQMDEQTRQRMWENPLRLLDSKAQELQEILQQAPLLRDFLSPKATQRFDSLRQLLDEAGIVHRVNPRLVRGLDYYSHTVFEWVAVDGLGGQDTLCAGGRYDTLSELLGGPANAAVGFALGLERLMLVLQAAGRAPEASGPRFFIASTDANTRRHALGMAEELRDLAPGTGVEVYCGEAGLSSQMKQAHAGGAVCVLILGNEELEAGSVRLKVMADGSEHNFLRGDLQLMLDWVEDELEEIADDLQYEANEHAG